MQAPRSNTLHLTNAGDCAIGSSVPSRPWALSPSQPNTNANTIHQARFAKVPPMRLQRHPTLGFMLSTPEKNHGDETDFCVRTTATVVAYQSGCEEPVRNEKICSSDSANCERRVSHFHTSTSPVWRRGGHTTVTCETLHRHSNSQRKNSTTAAAMECVRRRRNAQFAVLPARLSTQEAVGRDSLHQPESDCTRWVGV